MNKSHVKSYALILLGVFLLHLAFYFFMQPMGLITGGMMGISLMLQSYIPLSTGLTYLLLNTGALIIGGILFGRDFFVKTVFASILSPMLVTLFEVLNIQDTLILDQIDVHYKLLVASIASGVLAGVGIGLVLRYNATTGGMDVFQKVINKYLKVPFSVAVYATDGIIILVGAFISLQNGLFAALAMLLTAYMLEKTAVFGRNAFALMIITKKHDEIKQAIYAEIDRGVTRLKVTGGYLGVEKELILTTMNRQQLYIAKEFITQIDPDAFTLIISTKEVLGAGFHRDDLT